MDLRSCPGNSDRQSVVTPASLAMRRSASPTTPTPGLRQALEVRANAGLRWAQGAIGVKTLPRHWCMQSNSARMIGPLFAETCSYSSMIPKSLLGHVLKLDAYPRYAGIKTRSLRHVYRYRSYAQRISESCQPFRRSPLPELASLYHVVWDYPIVNAPNCPNAPLKKKKPSSTQ